MWFQSYRALLYKSVVFRKRTIFASGLLILIPTLSIVILIALKNASADSDNFAKVDKPAVEPTTSVKPMTFGDYVNNYYAARTCSALKSIHNDSPFAMCNKPTSLCASDPTSTTIDASGACSFQKLVVAPSDPSSALQVAQVDAFFAFIHNQYPMTTSGPPSNPSYVMVEKMSSQATLENYVTSPAYPSQQQVAFAVVFSSISPTSPSYFLRQNATFYRDLWNNNRPNVFTTAPTDTLFKDFQKAPKGNCEPRLQGGPSLGNEICSDLYMRNGVLTVQRLVNDFILGVGTVSVGGVGFIEFPNQAYTEDGFWGQIATFLPLFYLIGMIFPVIWTTKIVIADKERGMVSLLKTNSVSQATISFAHLSSFTAFYMIPVVLVSLVSASTFSNSDFSLIFALVVLFWISTTTFCLWVASLFNRAKLGAIFCVLIYTAGYFVTFAQSLDEGSKGLLVVLSLHPLGALTYALGVIAEYEDEGVGLISANVGIAPFEKTGYTFNDALGLMFLSGIMTWVGAWYFDRVMQVPREKLWFPFLPRYWFPSRKSAPPSSASPLNNPSSSFVEPIPYSDGPEPCIRVVNLRKVYSGSHPAVNDLSLDIFPNQITSILGHNGAGKTSTFACITGKESITSGDVYVNDVSVSSYPELAKKSIGYCPQHNVLYDWMTCSEHIRMFGMIKGCRFRDVERVDEALSDVALLAKKDALTSGLSGGMKRKLSIAIAFAGKSNVVFLDEPTSGMDVHSRRFVWSLIRRKRSEGRAVILSTHFLDEADILSDKIAVLSSGSLQCVGSPMFLKRAYGVGYQLTVENAVPSSIDVAALALDAVPEAKVLTNVGTEITLQLPTASQHLFPSLLSDLEEFKRNERIVTYGIGVTTLESVFILIEERAREVTDENGDLDLKIEKVPHPIKALAQDRFAQNVDTNRDSDDLDIEVVASPTKDLSFTKPTFLTHSAALLSKRFFIMKRDKLAFLFANVLPVFFTALGFLAALLGSRYNPMDPLVLSLDAQNPGIVGTSQNPVPFNGINSATSEFSCNAPTRCFAGTLDFGKEPCSQAFYPSASTLLCNPGTPTPFSPALPLNAAPVYNSAIQTVGEASTWLQSTRGSTAATKYGAVWVNFQENSPSTSGGTFTSQIQSACSAVVTTDPTCLAYNGLGYTVATNFTALHASVLYQTVADNSIRSFRKSSDVNTNGPITTGIYPLPFTDKQEKVSEATDAFTSWFLVVLSVPFIGASWIAFTVRERQSGSKYLQKISGVGVPSYWLSTLIYDMLNYVVTISIIIGVMFAFNAEGLTTTEYDIVYGIITLFFLLGPAFAGFTYLTSFFFDSPTSAMGFTIVFNFILSVGGAMTCLIFQLIEGSSVNENTVSVVVAWFLRWIPAFNFAHGVLYAINVANIDYSAETVFETRIILYDVIMLALEAVFYVALVIIVDYRDGVRVARGVRERFWKYLTCGCCKKSGKWVCSCGKGVVANIGGSADDDEEAQHGLLGSLNSDPEVEDEKVRAAAIERGDADTGGLAAHGGIVTVELKKTYRNGLQAVKGSSLAITGEVFGLLGTNGAGKTSTMKMIVGDEPITSGKAYVNGFSCTTAMPEVRKALGYCPQFDAHFDNMTGREHLRFYAIIKGVDNVDEVVAAALEGIRLSPEDGDKLAKNYSGGMKRKLSFGIATIARPSVIILDEPSTGMDPLARRQMWEVIDSLAKGTESAIVLTTHSMEEAEALCGRVTIMAEGEMKCLGSCQRLKDRYGDGFQIVCKLTIAGIGDKEYDDLVTAAQNYFVDGKRPDISGVRAFIHLVSPNEPEIANMVSLTSSSSAEGMQLAASCDTKARATLVEICSFVGQEKKVGRFIKVVKERWRDVEVTERNGDTIRFMVKRASVKEAGVGELFSFMEEMVTGGGKFVQDYTVSQVTLEDIFRTFAGRGEE